MYRISGVDTIDLGGGKQGFRDKNVNSGQPGTEVSAQWLNDIQEEICRLIENEQIPLDVSNRDQLSQAVRYLIQQSQPSFAIASGSANTLEVTLIPAPQAYTVGMPLRLIASAPNTGPVTVNVNGLGRKPVLNCTGLPLDAGALPAGVPIQMIYSGSAFVLTGLTTIASNGFSAFVVAGSYIWTVPPGIFRVRACVWGGGGGGGGSLNIYSAATGGGGGGYCEGVFAVTPGEDVPIVVGVGGAAGIAAGGNGLSGGTSSFGTFCTALGGSGGKGASSGTAANPEYRQDGGPGGAATGGIIQRSGSPGNGTYGEPGLLVGGTGGATYCGQTSRVTVAGAGANGLYPGDGGGGASSNMPGGAGAPGCVQLLY